MGGKSGGTQVIQPTPPPQPSYSSTIKEYIESLPQLYEAQAKYAPLEAKQQFELLQQYGVPMAQAFQQANEVLYPGTASLQEQLSNQALTGASAQVPQALQDQYRSDLAAQLGTNAASGIGADYVSRNLLNQQQQYQQYYQNLGLSLAGRQPLATAGVPGFTSQLAQSNPGQALNFAGGNYGTYAAAGRPMLGQQGTPNWLLGMQGAGSILQGVGSFFGGR